MLSVLRRCTDSDYSFGIFKFFLRSKIKDYVSQNQDNISDWIEISLYVQLFQLASPIKIKFTSVLFSLKMKFVPILHKMVVVLIILKRSRVSHALVITIYYVIYF